MPESKLYYDFNAIYEAGRKANCRNLMICGGKGNGKTFGALRKGLKIYLGLENPAEKGRVIRYARRLKETVRRNVLLNLFKPHYKWIEQVTDGKYNTVRMNGTRFYLAYVKRQRISASEKEGEMETFPLLKMDKETGEKLSPKEGRADGKFTDSTHEEKEE
jgi:hypothetical protein